MRTATIRELRNHYTRLLRWLEAGEEIAISRRGRVIARLVPAASNGAGKADWTTSAAVRRNRKSHIRLTARQSAKLLNDNKGIG
jgi:prevent-host-death family protein